MKCEQCAQNYLSELETGSNPARPKTLAAYRSTIRVHLLPRLGQMDLSEIAQQNNRLLRDMVRDLRIEYKPASIRFVVTLAKQVLESAKDANGLPAYPMRWASDYIDLPEIRDQKQPTITSEELRAVVQDGPDRVLYAFLAASGLRISEALGLVREDVQDGVVHVRQGKTANAARLVDLAPPIAEMMARVTGETKPGARIFPTSLTPLRERIRVPGFHSLRRFRESVLQRSEVRSLLCDYWMGHSNKDMSTRYAKQLLEDREYRREWAGRVGIGFTLPSQAPAAVQTSALVHDTL